MEKLNKIKAYCAITDLTKTLTIVDLEEKEFNGEILNKDESEAVRRYRKYRVKQLSKESDSEEKYHNNYEYIRALGNLVDYSEFLNKKSNFI